MSYKDDYKSIQVNLKKSKHQDLIEFLENLCQKEERSLNSLIIQVLKEYKDVKEGKDRDNIQSDK